MAKKVNSPSEGKILVELSGDEVYPVFDMKPVEDPKSPRVAGRKYMEVKPRFLLEYRHAAERFDNFQKRLQAMMRESG